MLHILYFLSSFIMQLYLVYRQINHDGLYFRNILLHIELAKIIGYSIYSVCMNKEAYLKMKTKQ